MQGQEYMSTCGYLPGPLAVYFVENHDKQMDCADTNGCAALTYKNGNLYKASCIWQISNMNRLLCT